MEIGSNYFDDILKLGTDYDLILAKSKELDDRAEKVELRKHALNDQVENLDNMSFDNANRVTSLINNLIQEVEKRKALKMKWDKTVDRKKFLNSTSESLEKIILNTNKISDKQSNTIELIIAEYEQLNSKQKQILNEREKVLEKEERLLSEIENSII